MPDRLILQHRIYRADLRAYLLERSEPELNTGCRLWSGATDSSGCGCAYVDGALMGAHRASWIAANGLLAPGEHVLHRCDTPACIEEHHLFVGDHATNMRDRSAKGRFDISGEKNGRSRLTSDQVAAIQSSTARSADLADLYNITPGHVRKIRSGVAWSGARNRTTERCA